MNRFLEVAIPYEFIEGTATISETTQMSEFQKRISAMIICADELNVQKDTFSSAMEKVYGVHKINQIVFEDDFKELMSQNFSIDENDEIHDQQIALLRMSMIKGVKESIVNGKFHLLTKSRSSKVMRKALSLFKGIDDIDNPRGFMPSQDTKFNPEIKIKSEVKYSILHASIHDSLLEDQILVEMIMNSENEIVWKEEKIEYTIANDKIVIPSGRGQTIMHLILGGKLKIDIEKQMNEEVSSLSLKHGDGMTVDINTIPKIIHSNDLFKSKFFIKQGEIHILYSNEKILKFNDSDIKYLSLVEDVISTEDFIKNNFTKINKDLFDLFDNKDKKYISTKILQGDFENSPLQLPELMKTLTIEEFKNLDDKTWKKLLSSLTTRIIIDDIFMDKFKNEDYSRYKLNSGLSYEDLIDKFNIQYSLGSSVFDEWEAEDNFFKELNELRGIKYAELTKKKIKEIKLKFQNSIADAFKKQKIYLNAITELDKKISLASEDDLATMEAIATNERKNLESIVRKISGVSKIKPGEFSKLAKESFEANDAKKVIEAYSKLSNLFMHSNNENETMNLSQLSKELKIIIDSITRIKGRG